MSNSIRTASHAGSWYSNDGSKLKSELQGYLGRVQPLKELEYHPPVLGCKAIIAPHAGYSYSGPAAAWAYAAIPTDRIKRVFLLGPSHHFHLSKIALSPFETYGTPLGNIPLDNHTIAKLRSTGSFGEMSRSQDEEEHSLEMHLPYLKLMFEKNPEMSLVPLLVGNLGTAIFQRYARILLPYWEDRETFFVFSSDFCHWGTRFHHTPYYPEIPPLLNPVPPVSMGTPACCSEDGSRPPRRLLELDRRNSKTELTDVEVWRSIEFMDHEAIDILRHGGKVGTAKQFQDYLERTENTICGRNPISMLLHIMETASGSGGEPASVKFVRYEQSGRNVDLNDSSVSYVSGLVLQ